jgi:hypothetical protein
MGSEAAQVAKARRASGGDDGDGDGGGGGGDWTPVAGAIAEGDDVASLI